jgi:pseudoazurin
MKRASLALGAALLWTAAPALAANVDVQMLNKGEKGAYVFEPDLVKVAVGDTVTFQPTDKGHNADAAAGMIPAGATPFKSELSQPFTATFTVPGVYVVKCDPHFGLGMVMVVEVGDDTSNLKAVEDAKYPGKAKERLHEIFEEIEK